MSERVTEENLEGVPGETPQGFQKKYTREFKEKSQKKLLEEFLKNLQNEQLIGFLKESLMTFSGGISECTPGETFFGALKKP